MSLPYFYEPSINAERSEYCLSEETSKHAVQVLRMKMHDSMLITDGQGHLHTATLYQPDKKHSIVRITNSSFSPKPIRKVSIGISLLKNAARIEWFLEKAVEIGVSEIIPLLCARTEKQHFRHDRMHNIVVSAMLQSQQSWLPVLHEPQQIGKIISTYQAQQKLLAHCEEEIKQDLLSVEVSNDILLLIGPEGDFSLEEIALAGQHNFKNVTLGNTRLRTETAGMVGAALLVNK